MRDLHTLDKYRDRDFGFRIHGGPGDAGNGAFKVYVREKSFFLHRQQRRGLGARQRVPLQPQTGDTAHLG